jgi:hypothetical protein
MKPWMVALAAVCAIVISAVSGTVGAMVVRSHDMERVATLEEQARSLQGNLRDQTAALHETDKDIKVVLGRIEDRQVALNDKIDRYLYQIRMNQR